VIARPWLQHYPAGVPAEIDEYEFSSIKDIFERSVQKFRTRVAFSNLGTTLTYEDLDRLSRDFAAYLQSLPGVRKGDRVALMMPNILDYPVALFGVLRAGLVAVNINPLYTARELEYQLKDSGARAIVILDNFAHVLQAVLPHTSLEHLVVTTLGGAHGFFKKRLIDFVVRHVKKLVPPYSLPGAISMHTALQQGRRQALKHVTLAHGDLAFLQYTGGTTGVARGAMLTHGNMVASLQQASAWIKGVLLEGEEIVVTALPMYHIFCLTANVLTFMKHGGHLLLITNPRDLPAFIRALQRVPFTVFTGVNTLFNGLLNQADFAKLDFSHLKLALGGGAAIQRAVAERWQQITGKPLMEAYGLTECSPGVCINPLNGEFNGSIGVPLPSTLVSIRDDAGREVPLGENGELCVKGPQVMRGYWQSPKATAEVLTPDGWLKTGDIARLDADAYIYITDRKKDVVLVSGFNVYPTEVENVIALHPGVLEAAVIGVPDAKTGEAVKLFVVRKDPNLAVDDLLSFCREQLTSYKIPHQIEFCVDLPKSPVGKILRRELRLPRPAAA
jgi:long-chain acyl-CoA synthetase